MGLAGWAGAVGGGTDSRAEPVCVHRRQHPGLRGGRRGSDARRFGPRNVVAWARRNAEISGLGEARIRWIAEDAGKFVRREARRGSTYDAVILDPPSYGHGPKGEVWRLTRHLPRLLALCAELTAGRCRFLLLTCHTPGYGPPRLEGMVRDAFGEPVEGRWSSGVMMLRTPAGRGLPSGVAVRIAGPSGGWMQSPG